MTQTPARSDRPAWAAEPQEFVPLGDGLRIRRRFGADGVRLRIGEREVTCSVEGAVVDGDPCFVAIRVEEPLRLGDLTHIPTIFERVVAANIQPADGFTVQVEERTVPWRLGRFASDGAEQVRSEQLRAARQVTRRRTLTEPFLREVAEQYAEGGVPAVAERYASPDGQPVSERTVRRWLAAAKERGLR